MLLETEVMQPQGKSHQQPPEAGRGQEQMLREPPKEAACQHLDLGLLASKTAHPLSPSSFCCLSLQAAGCQGHRSGI